MVITYEEYMKRKRKKLREASNDGVISLEKYAEINDIDLSSIRRETSPGQTAGSTVTAQQEEKDKKWYEGWFKKSEGDLGQTAKGTTADAAESALTGALGVGEAFLDTMAFLAPVLHGVTMAQTGQPVDMEQTQQMQKDAQELIKMDLYDESAAAKALVSDNARKIGIDTDRHSVFDTKTDSLMQSTGQLATTALLSPFVPWWLTTGTTAFGAEAENASRQGATYAEAGGSALVSAGAEILTEKISGGIKFGGKTLDETLVKPLTENISSTTLRTMAKMGFDTAGEGAEEVISQVFSNLGSALYREEDLGEILASQEALDGYIESFIGGAALGGVSSGGQAVVNTAKGVDHATGLTRNEKAVVDAIAEERIAEAEKDGKKLGIREKSKIRSEIEAEMDKGYLDIDKIESILGGDDYKAYDSVSKESEELTSLNRIKAMELTGEQSDRLAELKEKNRTASYESEKSRLKDILSQNVRKSVMNDRLAESYNEKGRRGKAFEADLSKYDTKQQATIQKAVDSGILNNTNRTHEFVDMIAKLSADKGVSFDFTNNQKLKESGFALEGKTVNGFIQDGNISLNINSAKALNKVVGHEITHVLEGTELYGELQDAIIQYAKDNGDYDSRWESIVKLYRKQFEGQMTDERMQQYKAELTADLVGDYLFSDPDFVSKLSAEKPNIFRKIYDEIKYMVKAATAGSREEKQLLEVQRAFDRAYKESKSNATQGSTKYHVSDTFSEEIDKTLDGTMEKSSLVKARDYTPKVLVDYGIADLPMLITQNHVKSIIYTEEQARELGLKINDKTHYHGLGKELLINAVDGLDTPLEIYKKSEDDFIIVTELQDSKGSTIIAPIRINGKGSYNNVYLDENHILSVYGKDNLDYYLKKNDFEKIYSKKGTTLNERDDFPNISDSFTNSISQNGGNTTENRKYSIRENASYPYVDKKYSLSSNDSAPSRNDVYGSDIMLDIPTRSDIAPVQENIMDDIPIRKDIPKVRDFEDIPVRADVRQSDDEKYKPKQTDYPSKKVKTVAERNEAQREALKTQLQEKQRLADEVHNTYNREIAGLLEEIERIEQLRIDSHASFNKKMSQLRSEYDAKPNKDTKAANALLQQIENTRIKRNEVETQYENQIYDIQGKIAEKKRHRAEADANSEKAINDLKARIDKMNTKEFKRAEKRMTKMQQYREEIRKLIGDTSTWVDKKMGIFYKVNTLRRNLRDIVRDENGNRNFAIADALYDYLQGAYNKHEAMLNREANAIKDFYRKLDITKEEDAYIQMLGEYRHNPNTTILAEDLTEYYNKHKDKIDDEKVDKVIEHARELYDELFERVNAVLREQGMQEIEYHKGYFPHFTEDKQGPIAKLLGWKTKNDDIPTDIAGLTENFNPNKSYQTFSQHRTGDSTDYSFMKGLDNYLQGSLDWIYHIEDIQKRRALENEIRYRHSEKGLQDRIEEINSNEEYSAEQAQEMIELVYKDAKNPLNNFVSTFRTQTNTLAGKKSSMDREMESDTNRRFYSTVTNLSNRVTANMVGGSVSSALTQLIPITQSWAEVSPVSSLQAMKETIASYYKDDGTIDRSDFLTNRLRKNEALYKTWWDKAGDKIGFLTEFCDNFTSQTVWRSKYMENISNGMSESAAIKNADQFCENIMAGRSRGNAPAIFDSKNPFYKMITLFQLEVNNQYQYMLKDLPQEMQNETKGKLVAAYGKMFVGAYVYNAMYSWMTGRDAAFDPIGIIEGVLRDMGLFGDDEEKEPGEIVGNLVEEIIEEVPFVGGLMGGGRNPISSALPYDDDGIGVDSIKSLITDFSEGDWKSIGEEMLNPVFYLLSPAGGGGQARKTIQGMKMFGMFGDDLPIAGSYTPSGKLRFSVDDDILTRLQAAVFGQYASANARDYFDNGRSPLTEKQTRELVMLDIPIRRYWDYRQGLKKIEADRDEDGNAIPGSKKQKTIEYIDSLDLDLEEKLILFKYQYPSDDTYNYQILEYLKGRDDISDAEKKVILKDLDFTIDDDGTVRWK